LTNVSRLPVCLDCLAVVEPISEGTCSICGDSLPQVAASADIRVCAGCEQEPPAYERAVSYGSYDGELRELIHLLKYEQVHPAGKVLGGMLAQAIAKLTLTGSVLVVPVPLHGGKRRQRGFNQSELICRVALKSSSLAPMELASGLLKRVRPTVSQIGLTRPQRVENLRGAFKVPHLNRVEDREILLVDDVMTSGTTVSECARVLRRAGAKKVWVATVARTLKHNAAGWHIESEAAVA
jgi:ComF family protein